MMWEYLVEKGSVAAICLGLIFGIVNQATAQGLAGALSIWLLVVGVATAVIASFLGHVEDDAESFGPLGAVAGVAIGVAVASHLAAGFFSTFALQSHHISFTLSPPAPSALMALGAWATAIAFAGIVILAVADYEHANTDTVDDPPDDPTEILDDGGDA